MIIYTIYKVVNTVNGKVYIGFDSNWPKRKTVHKSKYKNTDYKFYRSIRKYGWDKFVWESIYQSYDREHTLKEMEKHFISEYDSFQNGYNSTLGGDGVFGLHRKQSNEERERRKLVMLGNQIAKGKGKPFSEQRKQQLRKPRINVVGPLSENHKNNISKSLKGKITKKEKCPHCGKIGGISQMKQWHFDRCKFILQDNLPNLEIPK